MIPADPAAWKRAEELFFAALEIPFEKRSAWLEEQCQSDGVLRAHVEALLAADSSAQPRLEGVVSAVARGFETTATVPSLMTPSGRRIGPYLLVREIGRGGMGSVHHAIRADGEFFQTVAIKLIRRGLDPEFIDRFRQERHILARLDHPNIGRLIDGGTTEDGQPYLVMEYIDGSPITAYAREHGLDTARKLQLLLTVCDGVQHAHEAQVVHRDLKPANILVTRRGQAKLLDFGIAKWLNPEVAPQTVVETGTGLRMLTPDYASPEQVRGEVVTEATDIYSLGAILFELLTGEKPHRLETYSPAEVARAICEAETERPSAVVARRPDAPSNLRRELTGDLDRIVLKAMRKEPGERYSSIGEFAADIGRFLGGQPVMAKSSDFAYRSRKWLRRRRVAIGAIAAGLLITGFVGWKFVRAPAGEQVTSIAVLPFVNLSGQATGEVLSDGLTEDLITELTLVPNLRVLSRTAVWQYRGKSFDLREAGREMGVTAVLEGSVRSSPEGIRIVAQLISVADGFHLWAQSYDRKPGATLKIQTEISRTIVSDLRARLRGERSWNEMGRAAQNSEASKDFLEGYRLFRMDTIRAEWTSGIPPRLQSAIDAFERAVQKDPSFAAGWAALGEATEWAIGFDSRRAEEFRKKAEEAAKKALELEPTNPLALATLGSIYFYEDWDLRRARPMFRRAVEISPRNTGIQSDYANLLMASGRPQEAQEVLEQAEVLEPTSARLPGISASYLASQGRCADARERADRSLSIDPRYRHAAWALAYCAEQDGKYSDAEARYRQVLAWHPGEDRTRASLGHLLARMNRRMEALAIAKDFEAQLDSGRRWQCFAALVRTGLGDHSAALDLLDQGWKRHDPNIPYLHYEKRFAPLATNPRYQDLLLRLAALR